jgi:putative iron-regulated protein
MSFRSAKHRSAWAGALTFLALGWGGCHKRPETQRPSMPEGASEVLRTYADIAEAAYSEAATAVGALSRGVDALVASPSAATLDAARSAWRASRKPYAQTEVFRFYDGPIDRVEMLVNIWPIDETFVEGPVGSAELGIVDDVAKYPDISEDVLVSLNAKDGETSISTGFHVIEFLLWGRDTNPAGPGDRSFQDFVKARAAAPARRGRYLQVATRLLARHLDEVAHEWSHDQPGNYRARFLALPPSEAVVLVLKGMGSLSGAELSGERMTVAYETKAQENEHSCFSDNTQSDLAEDAVGIENVCRGRFQGASGKAIQGTGFCDWVVRADRALGEQLGREIGASVEATRAIPAPFDQAILGDDAAPGRVAVLRAIRALQAQTATMSDVARALSLPAPPARTARK